MFNTICHEPPSSAGRMKILFRTRRRDGTVPLVTPDSFRRSLRRGGRGPEPQDIWASVDGMPGVVLTVPSPEMFVMIDGLAVRARPESGSAFPGDAVRIRYDDHRLVAA